MLSCLLPDVITLWRRDGAGFARRLLRPVRVCAADGDASGDGLRADAATVYVFPSDMESCPEIRPGDLFARGESRAALPPPDGSVYRVRRVSHHACGREDLEHYRLVGERGLPEKGWI